MEKRKKVKKWPFVLAFLAVLAVVAVVLIRQVKAASEQLFQESRYAVARGSVVSSVTGTGVFAFEETGSLKLPQGLKLDKVLSRAGDSVRAGGEMATLSLSALETRQKELIARIASLDMQLGSMRSTDQDKVVSLYEGRVLRVYAQKGDDVQRVLLENGALALINIGGELKSEFESSVELKKGDKVELTLSTGKSVKAEVTSVSGKTATIVLSDADAPYGDTVKVYQDGALAGEAVLEAGTPITVVAEGGGIESVKVKENDKVRMGTTLFTLEGAPKSKAYYDAYDARKEAAETLETVRFYLNDPVVRAKEDCVVMAAHFKDGDTLAPAAQMGAASDADDVALFTLGYSLEVLFEADELDVPFIKAGQQAKITVNALPKESFTATVKSIAASGEAYNGVTSYRVRLTMEPDARLFQGMNCSATIAIDARENVVVAPLVALSEDASGMYAYIESGTERVRKDVTVGLSDGISAEIVSGLSEGDVILYADKDARMENMMKLLGERMR